MNDSMEISIKVFNMIRSLDIHDYIKLKIEYIKSIITNDDGVIIEYEDDVANIDDKIKLFAEILCTGVDIDSNQLINGSLGNLMITFKKINNHSFSLKYWY